MGKQEEKHRRINELIVSIKCTSSPSAVKELVQMFTPLIRKTCSSLYQRYGGLVSTDDLIKNARPLLIYLACMEYDMTSNVHFPGFIQTHLHARLVQYCRPVIAYRKRVMELKDTVTEEVDPRLEIYKADKERVMVQINTFMWKTFNDRELDIVLNHMINGVSRDTLAIRYGISKMRMKHVHKRCQEKLKIFLLKFGIKSCRDI